MRRAGISHTPAAAPAALPLRSPAAGVAPSPAGANGSGSGSGSGRRGSILPSFFAGGVEAEGGGGDDDDGRKKLRQRRDRCGCRGCGKNLVLRFCRRAPAPSPPRRPSRPSPISLFAKSAGFFPGPRPASPAAAAFGAALVLFVATFSWSLVVAAGRRRFLPAASSVPSRAASAGISYPSRMALISRLDRSRPAPSANFSLPGALLDDGYEVDDDATKEGRRSDPWRRQWSADYGGLALRTLEEGHEGRRILRDGSLDEGKADRARPADDTNDYYYSLDDDDMRNTYRGWHDDAIHKRKRCRRTRWHRSLPVNCNTFHELDVRDAAHRGGLSHVGAGSYKHVFIVETARTSAAAEQVSEGVVVWKNFGVSPKYDTKNYERMRKDALAAERVGPHPLIVDIYGYCGLAQLDQAMPYGGLESVALPRGFEYGVSPRDEGGLEPRNSLLPSEKLSLALDMFEAVALLHNYGEGVIVHDDIQLVQFLLTPDRKHVKLNDFNRMEVMLWNDQDQEYCRYRNGPGQGEWRSPEEYKDLPLDEKIDIFSLGNNVFSILTGLVPFYDLRGSNAAKQSVVDGVSPRVDPRWSNRSFAEGKLVELIGLCQSYKPEDRIDAGAAVQFLRDAIRENDLRHSREDGLVPAGRRP